MHVFDLQGTKERRHRRGLGEARVAGGTGSQRPHR